MDNEDLNDKSAMETEVRGHPGRPLHKNVVENIQKQGVQDETALKSGGKQEDADDTTAMMEAYEKAKAEEEAMLAEDMAKIREEERDRELLENDRVDFHVEGGRITR